MVIGKKTVSNMYCKGLFPARVFRLSERAILRDIKGKNMRLSTWSYAVLGVVTALSAPVMAATAVSKPAVVSESLPKLVLTNQILYQYLVAEIAGQRGDLKLASEAYLDLAKQTRDPRIAKRATEVAVYAQQSQAAESASKLWLDLDPESAHARQAAAAILLNGGKLDDAKPYLQQLLKANAANAGAEFIRMSALLDKQSDKAAVYGLLQELAQDYPNVPEAQLVLAQAAARANQFDAALQALDKTDKLKASWEPAAMLRMEILGRDGRPEGALFAQEFLKQNPDARELRLAYARMLLKQGQFVASREQFQLLAKAVPSSAEMQVAIGLISLQLGEMDVAQVAFKSAMDLNYADSSLLRLYLGQIAEAKNKLDEAKTWYASVPVGESYITAQSRYAGIIAKQQGVAKARAYLQQVKVSNEAERIQLIQAEVDLLRNAKDVAGVYALLTKALAAHPGSTDLLYDHAMAAEQVGQLDVVEKDLRQLLKLQPNHVQALNALGYTWADHNVRLAEALTLLQQALKLSPNDPFVLDSMGWLQYRLGNFKDAVDYLQRAYSQRRDPEIAAHLGEVMWAQGQHDAARQVWQDSLKEAPENTSLLAVMAKYK
jgi:Flp pilus assembly protein TadD